MLRTSAVVSLLLSLVAVASAQEKPADGVVAVADVPTNAWAKIDQSKTGGRDQPVFVYADKIKRFVMAAGMQATGGVVPRHYDTEEFDLATGKWINAYPADVAADRPESGPLDTAYAEKRARHNNNGRDGVFYKDGEHVRLGAGGQWLNSKVGYEYCYAPELNKVFVYLANKTISYDVAARTWQDLAAEPRTSNRLWGSMCYDPVNNEIFHAGGDGASDQIATWVYSVEKNQWRKLEFGSPEARKLHAASAAVIWQAKVLLGAVANRFTAAETADEAKADLKARAGELAAAIRKFAGEVDSAGLKGSEKAAGEVAVERLSAAAAAVEAVAGKLSGKITPEIVGEVRSAREVLEQAGDALAVEPPGRARSQVAYDPEHKKMVLFGGDNLDRTLNDTWLYDCATRTWEQKFPAASPLPRAGHILAWLPKGKQIVMAGGYSREPLAAQIWTYDVAANRWSLLSEAAKGDETPRGDARSNQVGAVGENDLLLCLASDGRQRTVWACKVDPSKTVAAGEGQTARPISYSFNRIDPADWEKVANPADPDAQRKRYATMPANQYTALKFARYAPGATNRWGTTAYDSDRHQLLFWGGGHATSHENDVAHFSVLGNCWTLGFHPDDPIENVYASQPTPISFHDRVHVPIHAYRAYCYDPQVDLMFYLDRGYDVAAREWRPGAFAGLKDRGPMHSHMESSPHGAFTFSSEGLFRFDARQNQWVAMPWEGGKPGGIWCDGDSMLYDSKRDCLWISSRSDLFRYDIASGKGEKVAVETPDFLGRFVWQGEEVYLPEADLVLLMRPFPKADGKLSPVVWDPNDHKYYWVDIRFVDEAGKPVQFNKPPFSWHDAVHYDKELNLVVLNNSSARKVWVMRFDRKSANLQEIKVEPKTEQK